MILLRVIFVAGAAVLTGAIIWAMGVDSRGLTAVLVDMGSYPWTLVTLVDLYFGFFIAAAMITLYERNWLARAFWALPVFFLGNIWTALWFVFRLPGIARKLQYKKTAG